MKKLIYIKDIKFKKKISLRMLLDDIGNIGDNYIWSFLELEATGHLGDSLSHNDIDEVIEKEPDGYCLSWGELKDLASKFDQVINTIIVATQDRDLIAQHKKDYDNLFRDFPLVIAILDGNFWEVSTYDENLVKEFKSKYEHVEVKDI